MTQQDIDNVRESVSSQCGNRVRIKLDCGRNKVREYSGVIEAAYPNVFTVMVDPKEDSNVSQRLSFTYTDIIIKSIRMMLE
ncbi:MAG: Veg family protein [Lachnospiraceae bacterium]|nr:Veg family protein [Lachnospiraceae bacterium]